MTDLQGITDLIDFIDITDLIYLKPRSMSLEHIAPNCKIFLNIVDIVTMSVILEVAMMIKGTKGKERNTFHPGPVSGFRP